MSVDFKTFRSCAPFVLNIRKPILLRGRHGIGKSEAVYDIAKDLDLPVVERRASQMTEGDLLGMPSPEQIEVNGERASIFRPFEWFLRACTEPVVLFLDEVDRATTEVRQGIFELTDSRKLAGWTLHPDTVVFAAVNGGDHGAQYQVNDMDPAELDRYTVFDLEPSVEDWLDWAHTNINPVIWDFINQNRSQLDHKDDFEPNKVYPSRRSWKRLNDCLESAELFAKNGDETMIYNLSVAFIGFEASVAFLDFLKNYDFQVTWEEVINEGQLEKVEKFDINNHLAMVEKMDTSGVFAEQLSETQLDNIAAYFKVLPSEVAMKLWLSVTSGSESTEGENIVRLHSRIRSRLVEMFADDTDTN